ncbi:MAG: D-alanyl-D-alanine carboxypeptidase [Candidatus Taylorbacteria bacterium]|nr:D-alanyl-D-alanine carboxypeptidase [Candidatus Taylorbacteria bacterium]
MSPFIIADFDKNLIASVVDIIEAEKTRQGNASRVATYDFDGLYALFSEEQRPSVEALFEKYMKIDPLAYGFKGEYLGIVPVPADLVTLTDQKCIIAGNEKIIPPQFIARDAYDAYVKMNEAMQAALGRPLFIESAYRSPAYQMFVLFYYLKQNDFDIAKTLKRVAMPGYSEHNYPPKQALDVMNVDGSSTDEEPFKFDETAEYQWLTENAGRFGFTMSYPKDNPKGIMYEPWHWSFDSRTVL